MKLELEDYIRKELSKRFNEAMAEGTFNVPMPFISIEYSIRDFLKEGKDKEQLKDGETLHNRI